VLAMRGRSLHVLDLSGDLPIFVAAAVSAGPRGDRIAFGFGAHFDRDRAALAAVSEMHQFAAQATLLERLASEGRAPTLSSDVVVFMEWWRSQFLADHPHLVPTQTRAPAGSSHYDIADSEADLERIVRELKHRNLTPLVLDLTRADIGVPAVEPSCRGCAHGGPALLQVDSIKYLWR